MALWRTFLCILTIACVRADEVVLVNGDRLSGSIEELDSGKLVLESEMMGAVTIPWRNVASVVSSQPLYVELKDGRLLTGVLTQTKEGFTLQRSEQVVHLKRDDVNVIRSFAQQLAWQRAEERRLAPHFLDPWQGTADLGFSLARGNADVTTYSTALNAVRTTLKDKLALTFTSLYSNNEAATAPLANANLIRGGARYERNFARRQFAFVSTDFDYDASQQLDLRSVQGAGFGWHVAKTRRNMFDIFAGATINREIFATGLKRVSGEALFSEESNHRVNGSITLKQKFAVYPNLTESREYRMAFDATAVTALRQWLSWQVTLSDRYLSNPLPGTVPNDLILTTGFRFTLLPYKPEQ
jgi:putative salt-induced outer membrane protein